ncbi:MAG: hypothetical protein KDA85_00695, partial [Planctomycetaceae bacterium]|nr:hypothetical protein [Planctomycetaceae bacterium]
QAAKGELWVDSLRLSHEVVRQEQPATTAIPVTAERADVQPVTSSTVSLLTIDCRADSELSISRFVAALRGRQAFQSVQLTDQHPAATAAEELRCVIVCRREVP